MDESRLANPFGPAPKTSENTDSIRFNVDSRGSHRVRKRLAGPETAGSTAGRTEPVGCCQRSARAPITAPARFLTQTAWSTRHRTSGSRFVRHLGLGSAEFAVSHIYLFP